jgi:hypothetical protein
MKSLMLLWQRTAADAAVQCCTSALRDCKTVEERFEHEGVSLLTLTLPEIGKEFERALDLGRVTDDLRSLTGSRAGFPVFLRNFLRLVFSTDGGLLLDDPSVDAIQAVRQLTLMFGKVLLPCSDTREKQAFQSFIQCEQEMRDAQFALDTATLRSFERVSSMLFGDVFSALDSDIRNGDVVPKHGPGATADALKGNLKYVQYEWTERLESIFPAREMLIPNERYHSHLDKLHFLDPGEERPVRVVSVPKTLKTPRIIAIEPTCMQYVQQGLMERFVTYLESEKVRNNNRPNPCRGMVGFTDQTLNQRLACEGSRTGELATLDLSEASDRVSLLLVHRMLLKYGFLSEAVLASRSTRADVPGHGVIPLVKFASMGSALTFPVEECVFLTAVFLGIEAELGRRLSPKLITKFRSQVRVYGDDIIVPVEFVPSVVSTLELLGFKVNHRKSFWTGKFRESCGKEYYDGHDVSIFRVRRLLPEHRSDAPGAISTVSLRNQAYKSGYWGTARYLDEVLGRLIPLPNVAEGAPVLGRESYLGYSEDRIHPRYQTPLVRGMIPWSLIPASQLDDEFAMLKCFLKRGREPYADRRHLERQGRPESVSMKLGWARPF